jgi:hypothetical protein
MAVTGSRYSVKKMEKKVGLDTLKRVAYNFIAGINKEVFIKTFDSEEEAKNGRSKIRIETGQSTIKEGNRHECKIDQLESPRITRFNDYHAVYFLAYPVCISN